MIFGGGRACGKTTELIRLASAKHLYIVCADSERAHHISKMANELDLDIPYPITVRELPLRDKRNFEQVLVDDAEYVLHQLIGRPVLYMTTSKELVNMKTDK